jgi:hypothetical protein
MLAAAGDFGFKELMFALTLDCAFSQGLEGVTLQSNQQTLAADSVFRQCSAAAVPPSRLWTRTSDRECSLGREWVSVPSRSQTSCAPVAAASAADAMHAPAAFKGETGNATKQLGDTSCDFAKEVDWTHGIFLQVLDKLRPLEVPKTIAKMSVMEAVADPELRPLEVPKTLAKKSNTKPLAASEARMEFLLALTGMPCTRRLVEWRPHAQQRRSWLSTMP